MDKGTKPSQESRVELEGITFQFKDIFNVVEDFYGQVATHKSLKVPFSSVKDWPCHVEKLSHFWWCRFGGKAYMDVLYNPPLKHLEAGFNEIFLKEWLELFHSVLEAKLSAEQARVWKGLTSRMGQFLLARNNQLLASLD